MAKKCYVFKNFRPDKMALIEIINKVIEEYMYQGYTLTLRQLYYQLVARGHIENSQKSYKNTGNLINDARLAGLIDWEAIEDRTRNLQRLPHWNSPAEIIATAAHQFDRDKWKYQPYYVEVWVEKEALANVVGKISNELDCPYFCCRGYVSQSEMRSAAMRFRQMQSRRKHVVLIHLGDHDPSGIDMSRDIQERLAMFEVNQDEFTFERIALNMEQIELYNPPPNPTKLTDTRVGTYLDEYGDESWELDALEPKVIHDLITEAVEKYSDPKEVDRVTKQVEREREVLEAVSDDWDSIYEKYSE